MTGQHELQDNPSTSSLSHPLGSKLRAKNVLEMDTIDHGEPSGSEVETDAPPGGRRDRGNHDDRLDHGRQNASERQTIAGHNAPSILNSHNHSSSVHSLHSLSNNTHGSTPRLLGSTSRIIRLFHRPNGSVDYTPNDFSDAPHPISKVAASLLLITSSALVAVCAEFLVNTIDEMVAHSPFSKPFIGLIILPIAGNVAEHVTAMTVAAKDKMDLAISVSLGSSIQIALFVTPLVVIVGWILDRDMTLHFSLFETVTLVAGAFLVNVIIVNGRTNYMEGSLLSASYFIIG